MSSPIIDPIQLRENQAKNKAFLETCKNPSALLVKSSQMHDVIQGSIKEHSVLSKVLPPTEVDPSQLEVGATTDTLYFRIHFQPNTYAHLSSFGATPKDFKEFRMDRVFGTFHLLQTPETEINEYFAMTYPFAVAPMIENNIPVDFSEARDWVLHRDLDRVIQEGRATFDNVFKGANVTAAWNAVSGTGTRVAIDPQDITQLKARMSQNRSGGLKMVVATEYDFIQLENSGITEFGDNLAGEVFVGGYTHDTVRGVQMIRTIKADPRGDVFKSGNVYAFSDSNELGRNYDYQGIKTDLRKEYQFIRFSARMAFGHIWIGSDRMQKLELYQQGRNLAGGVLTGEAVTGSAIGKSDLLWDDPELVAEHLYHSLATTPLVPDIVFV